MWSGGEGERKLMLLWHDQMFESRGRDGDNKRMR